MTAVEDPSSHEGPKLIAAATAVVAVAAIAARVLVAIRLSGGGPSAGTWGFYTLSLYEGRPYRDFEVAYPPIIFGIARALGSGISSASEFSTLLIWLNVAVDLSTAGVLNRAWGARAALFYLVASLPMVSLIYGTLDAVAALVAVIGLALWKSGRPRWAGVAVALSVFVKLWTAPLVLLGLARRAGARTFLIAAVIAGGAGGVAWLALGGVDGIMQVVTYRDARGWEIETIPGVLLLMIHGADAVFHNSGADRIGTVPDLLRVIVPLLGVLTAGWAVIRGSAVRRDAAGWLTATTAILVFATLLSPQFIWWLLPAAAVTWATGDHLMAALVAACVLLTGIQMWHWDWIVAARPGWLALLAVRNALLIALLCHGLISLSRRPPDLAASATAA